MTRFHAFGLACLGALAEGHTQLLGSAICTGSVSCRFVLGNESHASAWAEFDDSIASKGFATLHVVGRQGVDSLEMAFAAGVVEGYLTAERTSQHFNNSFVHNSRALAFLAENDRYVRGKISAEAGRSAYWQQVALVWAQVDGLIDGHRQAVAHGARARGLDRISFLYLNALMDLLSADWDSSVVSDWTAEKVAIFKATTTHCSALVKVTPDLSELWAAHATWAGFEYMLRVAKFYDLPFPGVAARTSAFSSYFGALSSNDDFFVLSSGLLVQETSNVVYPPRQDMRSAQSIFTWARAVMSNRVATDGESWAQWYGQETQWFGQSNQWMVVDYNKFEPQQPLVNGTLWILESIPGYVQSADVTSYLRNGHWASYNQAFFPEIRNLSGDDMMAERYGKQLSYDMDSRARLFRRDAPKVETREQLHKLMRSNNWQNDPLSAQGEGGPEEPRSPENAIASRYDLIPRDSKLKQQLDLRDANGAQDAKAVGRMDVLNMRFDFVVSPTHDTQVPFSWTGDWADTPHEGQPTTFNFDWHTVALSERSVSEAASSEASFIIWA